MVPPSCPQDAAQKICPSQAAPQELRSLRGRAGEREKRGRAKKQWREDPPPPRRRTATAGTAGGPATRAASRTGSWTTGTCGGWGWESENGGEKKRGEREV